ncbi:MAG: phosphotransferase [Deltaproteobacteria bacterium]|nr:phosphotransferase [Deltaproteobacteria bacterium]
MRDLLPPELQNEPVTPVGVGQSGAGVFTVGERHILKVSPAPKLATLRAASAAGLAPKLVHVDESRGAIVMERIVGPPFPAWFMGNPPQGIARLGETLRRVHDLPVPDGEHADPRGILRSRVIPPLPAWARATLDARMALPEPPRGPLVCSHNDVNPSNLAVDQERDALVLLDWDTAGPNDATWDLASIAMFMRLPDDACRELCAAHGNVEFDDRFRYEKRLVAAVCGGIFLSLAGQEFPDPELSLAECYAQMRMGSLSMATPQGRWAFGLALVRAAI